MGLFNKGDNESRLVSATTDKDAITSILDKEMTVTGNISFKGKARLDGRIEGNIKGEYLILSESSEIVGDIEADIVVCQGRVNGNIVAKQFFAKKGGTINGSLETTDLSVESGAALNGEVKASSQKLRLLQGSSAQESTPEAEVISSSKLKYSTTDK